MGAPDQSPTRTGGVSRRTLIAGGSAVVLLGTAGCHPFSSAKATTVTVTATDGSLPTLTDPMPSLIAVTRLHVLRLGVAVNLDTADKALLTQLKNDRTAHLNALVKELARTQGPAPTTATGPTTGSYQMPTAPAAVLPAIRVDAATAQQQFTDAMVRVSRYRAALFASIIACLTTHRLVLG